MFGNIQYVAILTSEHPDNPIKENIGDKEIRKITEVIVDEYWREYIFLLQYSDACSIFLDKLGSWRVKNSPLRKYIRECIKEMRKYRVHESFKSSESNIYAKYYDLERKLRFALNQLNQVRYIWIARKEHYEAKKHIKAQNQGNV